MPLSLKSHLKKFAHKGQITQEEYDALIKKLEGHDKEIRNNVIDEFAEKLCDVFSEEYGEVTVDGIKFDVLTLDGATEITWEVAEQLKAPYQKGE